MAYNYYLNYCNDKLNYNGKIIENNSYLICYDSEMNFNKLQFACSFLYDIIYSQIVHTLCDERFYFGSYPFLITMDEIRKDAMNIRAMNPELKCQTGIGYYCNI